MDLAELWRTHTIGMVIGTIIAIILEVVLAFVIANMACDRDRSVAGFVLLGILCSPILSIILLLILGDSSGGTGAHYSPSSASGNSLTQKSKICYCPRCGKAVSNTSSFCPDCGTQMPSEFMKQEQKDDATKGIKCPFCGNTVTNPEWPCQKCGKKLPMGLVKKELNVATDEHNTKEPQKTVETPKELFKCEKCSQVINRSVCPWCGHDNNR